jgi:hypothetical protein
VCCLKFALVPTVIEPPREGVHRQDQLERFSAKREHNQHTIVQYHIIHSSKRYYNLGSCVSYTKRFEAKITLQRLIRACRSDFSLGQDIPFCPKREWECHPSTFEAWGSQYGIQPSVVWTSHWQPSSASSARESSSSPAHRRQQEQSLSDYAQQDLSKMTKRSPLDMQGFIRIKRLISLLATSLRTIKHVN